MREWRGRGVVVWGVRLKMDVQRQGGGGLLDVDGEVGWAVLKIGQFSWTSCVYHPLRIVCRLEFVQDFAFLRVSICSVYMVQQIFCKGTLSFLVQMKFPSFSSHNLIFALYCGCAAIDL